MNEFDHLIEQQTFDNKAAMIVIVGNPVDYVRQIKEESQYLKANEKKALLAILNYCYENHAVDSPAVFFETSLLSKEFSIRGLGPSPSNIRKVLNKLTERKVFTKKIIDVHLKYGVKAKPLYFLASAVDLASLDPTEQEDFNLVEAAKQARIAKASLSQELASTIDYDELKSAFMLKQWGLLLFSLPLTRGKVDSRLDTIRIGKNKINVKSTSTPEYGICKDLDARTILHISTICVQTIKTQYDLGIKPENEFMLDLVDLCNLAKLSPTGANRETIRKSLNRMYHTNYNLNIVAETEQEEFMRNVVGIPDNEKNYRFLNELDTSYDRNMRGTRGAPRWFRISVMKSAFDSFCLQATSPEVHLWHKELLRYSNGLIHIMYQHFNVRILRSKDTDTELVYTENELHMELAPSSNILTFRTYFIEVIKKLFIQTDDDKPSGFFNVKRLGFDMSFELEHGTLVKARIKRDQQDPLTGANSKHRQLRRRNNALNNTPDIEQDTNMLPEYSSNKLDIL